MVHEIETRKLLPLYVLTTIYNRVIRARFVTCHAKFIFFIRFGTKMENFFLYVNKQQQKITVVEC